MLYICSIKITIKTWRQHFNTAKLKMKNQNLPIVQGEINKAQGGHYLQWDCPLTGCTHYIQGEIFYNKELERFEHTQDNWHTFPSDMSDSEIEEQLKDVYVVVAKL